MHKPRPLRGVHINSLLHSLMQPPLRQHPRVMAQIDLNKPLRDQAAIRGAFTNSGSKDVGPDTPDNPIYNKGMLSHFIGSLSQFAGYTCPGLMIHPVALKCLSTCL